MLTSLLLASLLTAPPAPLDAAALRARYSNLASLTAEISQVKEGRYWARPMRSTIALRWTPRRIEWETRSPVHSLVVIEGDALTITDAHGRVRSFGAVGDPRLQAIVTVLRAFLSLDLAAIERQYELQYLGSELLARLRPDATVRVFSAIHFRFNERLDITSLELEAEGERTSLAFDRLAWERGAPITP